MGQEVLAADPHALHQHQHVEQQLLVEVLLLVDVDLGQQPLDPLQRGRQEHRQRPLGSHLAERPAEAGCYPAGDPGLEDATLDVALDLAEGGVVDGGGGLREDGEEGGSQAHVLHAVLAVAPVVAGRLLLPGLLKGGALDEGERAVQELHDKVLDLGCLRADGPLLLRQVRVVLYW